MVLLLALFLRFFPEHINLWVNLLRTKGRGPGLRNTCYCTDQHVYHKQREKQRQLQYLLCLTSTNKNKELCFSKVHNQTETKSFVYKININKQKLRAWFAKPTQTNNLIYPKIITSPFCDFPDFTHSDRRGRLAPQMVKYLGGLF